MRKGNHRRPKGNVKITSDGRIFRPSDVKPTFLTSERSPPPKDDFEEDAEEDANSYVGHQETERARREHQAARAEIKAENEKRKRDGRPLLPLPKAPTSARKRRQEIELPKKRSKLEGSEEEEDGTEGPLGFNPLPKLASEPHEVFTVETIIHGHAVSTGTGPGIALQGKLLPSIETVNALTTVDDGKKTVGSPISAATIHETKPVVNSSAPAFTSENASVSKSVLSDVKPAMKSEPMFDPPIKDEVIEDVDEGAEEGEEEYDEEDVYVSFAPQQHPREDIKPHVSRASGPDPSVEDRKPTLQELESVEGAEEEEEEEYDSDGIVFPISRPNSAPALGSDDEVAEEAEEEEEEEDYGFEDWNADLVSLSHDNLSGSASQTPAQESMAERESERPTFEYSAEQAMIGPFQLDPDDPSIAIPRSINRFLRDYQRVGAAFLYRKYKQGHGGVLGDDMGLGKTIQVISFLSAVMRKTGTSKDYRRRKNAIRYGDQVITPQQWPTALIVCPKSLINNWTRELDTWGYFEYDVWTSKEYRTVSKKMQAGYLDIVLITDILLGSGDVIEFVKKLPISIVIVDEAHRMKRPDSRIALAVKQIKARACFALTGTLIQNRIEEVWSILDFVRRGWAGTFEQWKAYAVKPINEGHKFDGTIFEVIESIKRVGELNKKVLPHFYLRRDKRLIAHEMPKKREFTYLCPLGYRQAAVYQRVVDSQVVKDVIEYSTRLCECGSGRKAVRCHKPKFESELGDDVRVVMFKLFHAFTRISNHLVLLYQNDDDTAESKAINARYFKFATGDIYDPDKDKSGEALYDAANCGKWNVLFNLLLEWRSKPEEKNKVLIFSSSVRLLKAIDQFIMVFMAGFKTSLFTGELKQEDRMDMVDSFQDPNLDHFIMLVSTMAGGVGLNLTAANKVVIFDPSWNPAIDLQAMDRAFRIGQKRPVDVIRLVGKGTLEELMYERQIYKQQRARQLNDGTFERRTHTGVDRSNVDKGELFGLKNMFRYCPEGFAEQNLQRVRLTEEQIRADLVEAQYEDESDDEDDDEGRSMRQQRRQKDVRRAMQSREENDLFNEIISGEQDTESEEDRILKDLGITALHHASAFKDSAEERELFELGLQILAADPKLARLVRANDAGKLRVRQAKRAKKEAKDEPAVEEDPWKARLEKREKRWNAPRRALVVDDDDDDE